MKILLPLLLCFSLCSNAAQLTITNNGLIGTWTGYEGFDDAQLNRNPAGKLIITNEFNVTYIKNKKSGTTYKLTAIQNDIKSNNDVFIIPLQLDGKKQFLLVISGWTDGSQKYMYGALYTYNGKGQIYFGTPISFRPETDNKSSNLTGAYNAPPS